jgi:ribosomal protein L37AE/L43A
MKRKKCHSCKKLTLGRLAGVPLCNKCHRKAHGGGKGCGCEGCKTDPDKS